MCIRDRKSAARRSFRWTHCRTAPAAKWTRAYAAPPALSLSLIHIYAKARGAKIYCEVLGYGQSADAYNLVAPDPESLGVELALKRSLEHSGIGPGEVDYINAHGTSTPQGEMCIRDRPYPPQPPRRLENAWRRFHIWRARVRSRVRAAPARRDPVRDNRLVRRARRGPAIAATPSGAAMRSPKRS